MIKKILVPVTFGKYSRAILDYAVLIATSVDAELSLVNVINERDIDAVNKITTFGYKVDSKDYLKSVKEERRREMNALVEGIAFPEERMSYNLLVGDPAFELLKFIVEHDLDMVIMGVKSKDLKHMFTGSVAEKMFRRCPVPIISYRGGDIQKRLEKRVRKHINDG